MPFSTIFQFYYTIFNIISILVCHLFQFFIPFSTLFQFYYAIFNNISILLHHFQHYFNFMMPFVSILLCDFQHYFNVITLFSTLFQFYYAICFDFIMPFSTLFQFYHTIFNIVSVIFNYIVVGSLPVLFSGRFVLQALCIVFFPSHWLLYLLNILENCRRQQERDQPCGNDTVKM